MDSAAPPPASVAAPKTRRGAALWRRLAGGLVLRAHRLTDRFDQVPPEFGAAGPVDETDPRALLREWMRILRQWADYNPEEVFAWKVGGAMLLAAILGLWILVGLAR